MDTIKNKRSPVTTCSVICEFSNETGNSLPCFFPAFEIVCINDLAEEMYNGIALSAKIS